MSDVKVSALPVDSSPTTDDRVVVLDIGTTTLKTTTLLSIFNLFASQADTALDEGFYDYIASGCVWTGDSYGTNRNASCTSGVVYIGGKRLTVAAVAARTFTASKDVYCDLKDNGDGTASWVYADITTNNASPSFATTTGQFRGAIVVVGASSIANAGSINQGQEDKLLPIASSTPYAVTDSLGNLICNRAARPKLIGYRQITAAASVTNTTTATQVPGLAVPVIVPTGRKIEVELWTNQLGDNSNNNTAPIMEIWEGTVGSGTRRARAAIAQAGAGVAVRVPAVARGSYTPTSSSITLNAAIFNSVGTSNTTIDAAATYPAYLKVSLA